VIKTFPSATDTKQPDVWEVSSTSTSNTRTSAEWNYRVTNNIWGNDITSTASYNIQTQPIVKSYDFALKTDTPESRPGWEEAKPDVYAGEAVFHHPHRVDQRPRSLRRPRHR